MAIDLDNLRRQITSSRALVHMQAHQRGTRPNSRPEAFYAAR
jgi:hypothetical protein